MRETQPQTKTPAQRWRAFRATLAFVFGLTVCGLALSPKLFPVQTYKAWCALRYDGAIPSAKGLLLTIREAPPGLRGSGRGPWIELEFCNVGEAPLAFLHPERLGDELGFRVEGVDVVATPDATTEASWVHTVVIQPGERIGFTCDLARWVTLPAPGTYTVRAERISFGLREGGLPSVSNALQVQWSRSD